MVTGAASGLGLGIAARFASLGAHVWALDLNDAGLNTSAAVEYPGGVVHYVRCDVADEESVNCAIGECVGGVGRIDVLVNNAGIVRDRVVWKMATPAWDAVLDVHLRGAFNMVRRVVPEMRRTGFGRIVNVTSYSGLHGNFGQSNYAAAKAGIVGFTKSVAKEVAGFGITVNAVSPNAWTPMVKKIPSPERAAIEQQVPMGRFGRIDEVSPVVTFLASEEASYVTGAIVPVDGGLSM